MNTEKIINIDGYAIPVSVAFKIYDRVKALFCDDEVVPAVAITKPQVQKKAIINVHPRIPLDVFATITKRRGELTAVARQAFEHEIAHRTVDYFYPMFNSKPCKSTTVVVPANVFAEITRRAKTTKTKKTIYAGQMIVAYLKSLNQ